MRLLAVGLLLALLGACAREDSEPRTAPPEPTPTPSRSHPEPPAPPTTTPTTTPTAPSGADAPSYSTWVVGSEVLPLRPDGYGEIRPTPPTLRVRRYPTVDRLPPPGDAIFASTIGPITAEVSGRMGSSWTPGCPVPLDGLRYLTVSFHGYDGASHTGELVVAASEAADIVSVFRALFRADFPIEEMRLPTTADLDATPTGDGNNTAAFVCRPTTGGTSTLSAHAYGLALDLDPFVNPYLRGDLVLPERASSYLDRGWHRPGMVYADGLAVRAFARIGWSWGGDFSTLKDYQHFTATGR